MASEALGLLPGAGALIARLARPAPADTAYTEVRFVGMLKQPLVLHGELHYGGAGKLGKRVDQPYRETTNIAADGSVEVQRADKPVQRFSLDRAPELQTLLAAFGALLGGDAATLAKYYQVDAIELGSDFSLKLTARATRPENSTASSSASTAAATPRCFSLYQPDGDASVMLLGSLAAATLPDPPTRGALEKSCPSPRHR